MLFYWEIIRVIFTILTVLIENLKLYMNNSNLLIKKSSISFGLTFQKELNDRNCIFTIMSYLWLFKSGKSYTSLIITIPKYKYIN